MPKPLVSSQATFASDKKRSFTAALMVDNEVIDQVVEATPILSWSMGLDQQGSDGKKVKLSDLRPSRQLKFFSGGLSFDFKARTGTNSTFASMDDGYDEVDITPQQGFTTLSEEPALYAGSVTIDIISQLQNEGNETREVDNLEATIEQGFADARETMQTHMWQTAAAAASSDIKGILHWVPADPTSGSIATADRSTDTWFRSQYNGASGFSTNTTPSFGADGLSMMIQAVIASSGGQGADEVTDIWNATDVFRYYYLRLQPQEMYSPSGPRDANGAPLLWNGKRMWYDGGIPSGVQLFLNRNYWQFRVHSNAFFSITEFSTGQNVLSRVAKQIFYGTPICLRPSRQAYVGGYTS